MTATEPVGAVPRVGKLLFYADFPHVDALASSTEYWLTSVDIWGRTTRYAKTVADWMRNPIASDAAERPRLR